MRNLFAFIYRYRGFLVFLLLEIVCGYLIVQNNNYQGAAFYNSANMYAGRVMEFQREVSDYFRLIEVNRALVDENRELKESLTKVMTSGILEKIPPAPDSTYRTKPDSLALAQEKLNNFGLLKTFQFIPGKVVNNSVRRVNNYLTINVGSADGVEPGMGVVSSEGVIGRVKATSEHYATVTSILHSQMLVSSKIRRNGTIGSVKWGGENYLMANLNYIPRHIKVMKGDTVVTSGYNAVFPEGVMVGRVTSVAKEADQSFYTIRMRLAVDFDKLSYVYVIKNLHRTERDSLELKSGITEENE
ncbi:rod shape-determining protein MreC [Adhaeribacter aquaticus]|uniref:rod shape-determining protein MreC n=1 Tax=Adhaeribacter aquaticus TaxID=299567 RepID=UPI0004256F2E|nr:rod shape-determining protein MreC [Adhaeribacter aquaticus]